jgi:hypothetical protein
MLPDRSDSFRRRLVGRFGLILLAAAGLALAAPAEAGSFSLSDWWHRVKGPWGHPACGPYPPAEADVGGAWLWQGSPEEERRVIAGLYNRYCLRCHGVDGRGVWDMPGVPSFADPRWQASRSDAQIVRILIEGRGAVMPAFRGTLSLEEDHAMARYLRTFVPGNEGSVPFPRGGEKDADKEGPKGGDKEMLPLPKRPVQNP